MGVLREQAAGVPAADLCGKHGLGSSTFYKWKANYGGLNVAEARRLKALEAKNVKPKRMPAESSSISALGFRNAHGLCPTGDDEPSTMVAIMIFRISKSWA